MTPYNTRELEEVAQLLEKEGVIIKDSTSPNYFDIVTDKARISVEARPHYCDRGRFIVKVDSLSMDLEIDNQDLFPRYYFGVEACVSEIVAWMKARGIYESAFTKEN